jgi:predicted dienelactone hydrolase
MILNPRRRRAAALFFLLALSTLSFAGKKEKKKEEPILRNVGFSLRQFTAPEGYNWRGSEDQFLSAIVWYPAESTAEVKDQYIGDPPIFHAGSAAKDATLAPSFGGYPLVALSHGTGGSALQMAWLGTYLAARGYIVVAVNHPGNNAVTGYTPQGFVEGWERAKDISTVIDGMLADRRFGPKIDRERIGAAGFSFGGYTMLELAGATTDVNGLIGWCEMPEHRNSCNPPEMPDLVDKFETIKQSPEVKQSLQNGGGSYRDPRIRAVFAIAPGIQHAFKMESLQGITIPVAMVAGDGDKILPPDDNAKVFAANIKGSQLTILPGRVGHYTFLDVGTDLGKQKLPQFFVDEPGVDREAIHKQVSEMAADFFDKELVPPKKKK